jgi:tetratricopeptide (TPR) repeat protein
VSQSPVDDFSSQSTLRYQQGWRALNRLLHEDRSFSGRERKCLFLNCRANSDGSLNRFADASSATGFDLPDDGRGIAVCDWDFDGDLDLWMSNRTAPRVRLLRNLSETSNHFLAVKLEGDGKTVNRDAIGARIELYLSASDPAPLIRTVHAGESFISQSSPWVHFGLGDASTVDRMVVHWPGGDKEEIRIAETDQFYLISMGSGRATPWTAPTQRAQLLATKMELPPDTEQARIVVPAGLPMPEIRTVDEAGEAKAWQRGGSGPLVINLWASWCGPCVAELSEWSAAREKFKQAGLEVVALNTDALGREDATPAAELLQKIDFPYASFAASESTVQALNALQQAVLDRWKPLPVPSTFLVDASGEIVVIYKGPVTVEQLLADQKLLRATPEQRRTAGTPFSGRWVDDAAPRGSPRRVANQLLDQNQMDQAVRYLYRIVENSADPADPNARRELGDTLYFLGVLHEMRRETTEAREVLTKAGRLLPDDVRIRGQLGKLLLRIGEFAEAAGELSAAVRINPSDLELSQHLGVTLYQLNETERAIGVLQQVVDRNPQNATAWYFLGNAELKSRQFTQAIEAYRKATEAAPNLLDAHNNLAWILSVHPEKQFRSGEEALRIAKRLCEATRFQEARFLDTLAVAYAETGQFEPAVETAKKAIEVAGQAARNDAAEVAIKPIQDRLKLFENREAYREMEWVSP